MKHLSRIAAILLRQFYLIRGSPARLLPLFVWAGVDIVLWGFITRYLNAINPSGLNFIPVLLGAVLLWDFFTRVMYGVTTTFLEDVWSRNFLNLFATPLSISEYLGGLVISSIVTSSIGLAVMLILAIVVFGLSFFVYGLLLIPFLLVLFHVRHRAGHPGLRPGAALRPGGGVVRLAHPGGPLALRGRLLPALGAAPLDAVLLARLAAVVRLRVDALDPRRRPRSGPQPPLGHRRWPSSTSCWPVGTSPASTATPSAPA